MNRKRLIVTVSLFLATSMLAVISCESIPFGGPTPTQEASVTPDHTNTPIPIPTRTPAPTARPLIEYAERAGIYENALTGVSLEYPTSWEIEIERENGLDFVSLIAPFDPLMVCLETDFIGYEDDLEILAEEFFYFLQEAFQIENLQTVEIDPEYVLAAGRDAWWGRGEGQIPDGEWMTYEIIMTQRGYYVFTLVFFGIQGTLDDHASVLEDIRSSFQVFPPHPYGVSRENALFLPSSEPVTFDPAKWHFSPDSIIGDLFSGLVKLNTDLQVIPDLAESWTISSDGRVYTFALRQDVTFHSGRRLTAEDVKFSLNRACDPSTESDTARTYLSDIQGATAVIDGEADEITGVKVLDEYALEITLDEPRSYFLYKLAYNTSFIVDRETIDEIEDNPIGTGPFKMIQHDEGQLIILARNENYYRGPVSLEYVVYLIYQGYPIRLYEAGDIDAVYIDQELRERAEDPSDPLFGNVQPVHELCTYYVMYDLSRPPFDDMHVREAFTRSIDKERFNEVVYDNKGVIANGLYPPGLPGYNPDVHPIEYGPEGARAALTASSYGGFEGLPEIVFTTMGEGGDLSIDDALLIQMWEDTLGVTINVEQIDYDSFYDEIYAGNHGQILYLGWCADYPDPENFADLIFHTGNELNHGNYSNPELDELLESARVMQDIETRLALYQEIEQTIINDMPAAFIMHDRPSYLVTKPYVYGMETPPIGVAQLMNVWIERDD